MKKQTSLLEDECDLQMTLDDVLPTQPQDPSSLNVQLEQTLTSQMSAQLDEMTARYHELMAKVSLLQAQELESREKLQLLSSTLSETLATTQKLASRRVMEEVRLTELKARSDELSEQMERDLANTQQRLGQLEQQCAKRETELAETLAAIELKRLELGSLEQQRQH
jgi:multidrug resistance efflux pump